jgi:hypothetical protein
VKATVVAECSTDPDVRDYVRSLGSKWSGVRETGRQTIRQVRPRNGVVEVAIVEPDNGPAKRNGACLRAEPARGGNVGRARARLSFENLDVCGLLERRVQDIRREHGDKYQYQHDSRRDPYDRAVLLRGSRGFRGLLQGPFSNPFLRLSLT